MFGTCRQLTAGAVSARILDYGSRYARFVGFFWFGIEANQSDGSLVARNHSWYKWFCLLSRLVLAALYGYTAVNRILSFSDQNLFMLTLIHVICNLISCFIIVIMQLWCGQRVLRSVNDFLRLFRRVRALPGCHGMGFGGKHELILLIFKLICVLYEIPFMLLNPNLNFDGIFDIYMTISAALITHGCFVAFLSVGALYDQMNSYVRHELRRQLRSLGQQSGEEASRRELKSAEYRLDQCVAIYDEIQRVTNRFLKLMDLPISCLLLIVFLSMTVIMYNVMCSGFRSVLLWLLAVKKFTDFLLLTLAIHGATNSSRVIQRLSLENCYVCESKAWHMRVSKSLKRIFIFDLHLMHISS